jgi:hypothetical protein
MNLSPQNYTYSYYIASFPALSHPVGTTMEKGWKISEKPWKPWELLRSILGEKNKKTPNHLEHSVNFHIFAV